MAFRVGDVLGLICSHPIASLAVLLLFTPPLFPIVVYFSPLLISTALVVLAMVSMGSHVQPNPHHGNEVHYKRGWIEEVSEDGPELEGERESKRLRAASKEDRWLDKMKNWEGTGRAWMESVLSQESRANLGSDHTGTPKSDSRPFLSATQELVGQESNNKQVRGNEEKLTRQDENRETTDSANQSALSVVTSGSLEIVPSNSEELSKATKNIDTEITGSVKPDGGCLDNSSESIPSSPLFRTRSASRREAGGPDASRELKTEDTSSTLGEDSSKALQIVCPSSAPEKGKEKDLSAQSDVESDAVSGVKKDEAEASSKVEGSGMVQTLEIVPFEGEHPPQKPVLDQEKGHDSSLEKEPEKKPIASNADGSVVDKPYPTGTTQVLSKKPSRLATDLLGQGKVADGADSPSAAVALSEKLKVPLADIMSLLTGDEKENANLDSGSGMKASTSSESTTSQEEEWSSSDGESTAPTNNSDVAKSSAEL